MFLIPGNSASEDDLLFRRQFIMGPRLVDRFPLWQCAGIGASLILQAHHDLELVQVEEGGLQLTLLGFLIDPDNPGHDNQAILERSLSQVREPRDIFELTSRFGGRWILILDDGSDTILFTDPGGLRQVYYTDPVCGPGEIWCGSQPGIIAGELGFRVDRQVKKLFIESAFVRKDIEYWWPGDGSPFREIRHLLPNHYLDVRAKTAHRFWPERELERISLDEGVFRCADMLKRLLECANRRFKMALTVTAGLDTRMLLAASRNIRESIYYYTLIYYSLTPRSPDVDIPARLLSKLGLDHHVIECPSSVDGDFERLYKRNVTLAHDAWAPIALGLLREFPQDRVAVKGNSSGVARCFYSPEKRNPKGIDAEVLAMLAGMDGNEYAIGRLDSWLAGAREAAELGYHILDLLVWEQRLGNWQAMSQLEWDIAQEVYTPFNCRDLLNTLLSVDEKHRRPPRFRLHRKMIEYLWSETLSEPVNPVSLPKRITRMIRPRRRFERATIYAKRLWKP